MKTIFEKSSPGRASVDVPELKFKEDIQIPKKYLRQKVELPEVTEIDLVRHYTELSRRNFGVDLGFYPLGSCTMKYNPKINEAVSRLPGFSAIHPDAPVESIQGALQILYETENYLREITGMAGITLQPAAGAHGELTSVMIIKKYFQSLGENRAKILIPDSAHGTNPASAAHCGFRVLEIKSDEKGNVDIERLENMMDEEVAAVMITYPNTLGLYDQEILEIGKIVHKHGALLYMDGANLNSLLGIARPGDLGADLIQLNLHKTFSTPHGGGGPGSGPVGVCEKLIGFLPNPRIIKEDDHYCFDDSYSESIGKVKSYYGNFNVILKAYTYIRSLGPEGLKAVAENAVLNANYLKEKLKKIYHLAYDRRCAHEFVLSDKDMPNGVTTMHIAKRILDFGMHAPTIYFPLIVHGAIMIEPTETESRETLDMFVKVMKQIHDEAKNEPDKVKNAPHNLFVGPLDNVKAARELDVCWKG